MPGWVERFLNPAVTRLWPRPKIAEFILHFTTWVAAWHIVLTDDQVDQVWWPDIGLTEMYVEVWTFVILTSPVYVALAWLLIHVARGGRYSVIGLWLRLGGDVGVTTSLAAFIYSRLAFYNFEPTDAAFFALIMLTGIAVFTASLVIRDVLVLRRMVLLTRVLEYEIDPARLAYETGEES